MKSGLPQSELMNCPVCKNITLVMADRQGIEVDYCPQCRGVWLDRGELDKLIERAAATGAPEREASPPRDPGAGAYRKYRDDDDDYRSKKKKRGFLGDLFDFD